MFSRLEPTNSVALWTADIESGQEARLTSPAAAGVTGGVRGRTMASGSRSIVCRAARHLICIWSRHRAGNRARCSRTRRPAAVRQPGRSRPPPSVRSRRTVGGDVSEVEIGTGKIRQLTVGARGIPPILSIHRPHRLLAVEPRDFLLQDARRQPGGRARADMTSAGSNFAQRFSPDGRQLVFQSSRAGSSVLWLHDMETGTERQLTYPPAGREDRTPDWSPDGKQVVFLSNRAGPFQLWVGDVDGGATRRLSEQAIPMDGDWWVNARVAPRWSSDGRAIAYLAPGERGSMLSLISPDGRNARPTQVSGVLRFDWYLDSRRAIYTRNGADGRIEMIATNLDTGEEGLLLKANATELSVAPDGNSVAYNSADGHFSMNRYALTLGRPTGAKALPQATGAPRQITFGKGKWHVHGGAWSADSRWIVCTRDFDRGKLSVIDNYR